VAWVFVSILPLEEMMQPKYMTRTVLGMVAVLALLAALISPIPAYAKTSGGHEPPPPKPPSNDLGSAGKSGSPGKPDGKSGQATSAAASGAASPGTPLRLAALLSVGGLTPTKAGALPQQVKFCAQSNPDFMTGNCTQTTTIEDMITYIKSLPDASGVIYVDQAYSTGFIPPQPGLVFDQSTFTGAGPTLVTDLTVHGGIVYNSGLQSTTKTILNQPLTVQNFNDLSKFSLDMFQFNVSGYAAGDPATAAVNVVSSNHVTLTDLVIFETGAGNGVSVNQSNDLTLQKVSVLDSGGGVGVYSNQSSKILLDQVGSTSSSRTGYGAFMVGNTDTLTITTSHFDGNTNDGVFVLSQAGNISLDGVTADGNSALGAAFSSNTGTLTISNSNFDSNANQGLQVFSQTGPTSLDAVTATGNVSIGASFTSSSSSISLLNSQFNDNGAVGLNLSGDSGQVNLDGVTADGNQTLGASFVNQSNGDLTILNSFFDNNGTGGLSANVIGGAITLNNVSASSSVKNNGATLNSFLPSGSLVPGIQVTGGNFSGNAARGMQASSTGEIDITGASFLSNATDGLALTGLDNQSAINLIGVQAGSNGGIGAQVSFTGDVQVAASLFTGNGKGGLDLEYNYMPPAFGVTPPVSFTVTLDQVQAATNGAYGALVNAGQSSSFPPVDLFITNSNFDQNTGTDQAGLAINTLGSVNLDNVSASGNAGNGANITSLNLFINNSLFNSNAGYGLALEQGGTAALANVKACFNGLGPLDLLGGTPLFQNLDTTCVVPTTASNHASVPPDVGGLPWQTIIVFSDASQGSGNLSCQVGTTFIFKQKGTPPTADQELARVDLPPCIAPAGSTVTLQVLAQAGLPAPLPDGTTFQGPALNLAITGQGGRPENLSGALTIHFSLSDGFKLPAGKKLAVLWFDTAANQWVELPTSAGPNAAFAFPTRTGVFVLVLK
jgi:hypothetical protein